MLDVLSEGEEASEVCMSTGLIIHIDDNDCYVFFCRK